MPRQNIKIDAPAYFSQGSYLVLQSTSSRLQFEAHQNHINLFFITGIKCTIRILFMLPGLLYTVLSHGIVFYDFMDVFLQCHQIKIMKQQSN